MEKCTVSLCPKCGRCFIVGTTHNCITYDTNTTAGGTEWYNVPAQTFEYPQQYPNYWWWPYYVYPYTSGSQPCHHDYRPKCKNENCIYQKRSYSDDFGECNCKSVYINQKGKCVSFVDKYKTDAD